MDYQFFVSETYRIADFFNNEKSDDLIYSLSYQFHIPIKNGFDVELQRVYVTNKLEKVKGGETAGEYNDSDKSITYSKVGLDELGIRLVRHEVGHAIFDQVFDTKSLPDSIKAEKSEEMAVYFEGLQL